jgi:hypothetical protein
MNPHLKIWEGTGLEERMWQGGGEGKEAGSNSEQSHSYEGEIIWTLQAEEGSKPVGQSLSTLFSTTSLATHFWRDLRMLCEVTWRLRFSHCLLSPGVGGISSTLQKRKLRFTETQ